MSVWRRAASLLVISLGSVLPAIAKEPVVEPTPWLRSWFPPVRSFTFRTGAVNQNGQRLQAEFRLIMNYEIPVL